MYNFTSDIPIIEANMHYLPNSGEQPDLLNHYNCRFLTVLSGEINISDTNGDYELQKDDLFYIPCEHAYRISAKAPSIILYIGFHPCFLLGVLGFEFLNIVCNSAGHSQDSHREFRKRIAALAIAVTSTAPDNQFAAYSAAYDALLYIKQNFIPLHIDSHYSNTRQVAKQQELLTYIGENYSHSVTLSLAAKALNYTPQYLSNFIKKHMHMTFNELLNHHRLEATFLFLRYTNENANRIASLCGFPNMVSYTNALGKTYQTTPEKYLENYPLLPANNRGQHFTDISHPSAIRNYILNHMNYACEPVTLVSSSIQQALTVNARQSTPLKPYWNTLINLGDTNDFEKPAFRKHLIMMQEDLSFTYGRITGFLPLTRVFKQAQENHYDFSRIFEIIDFLKSIRLKPFLDIDTKPFHIYKEDPAESKNYTTVLKTAEYDEFLFSILPHFIRACINRYGFDEFSTWKFELWRRYNPSMTSLESPADFVTRFNQVAEVFTSMNCQFALGGPGFNPYLDTANFELLLAAFADSQHQPAFISAYYFPYTQTKAAPSLPDYNYQIEPSANAMLSKITELKNALEQHGFSETPFYITEYTSYILSGNYVNDSTFPATYIFQQVVKNIGKTDALGYWLASDISLEHSHSAAPLFGGNGIISRHGIKKASYYAFDFLNKLGTGLIAHGEHYIITKSNAYRFQILFYYNNDISTFFSDDPMNEELLHYPYYGFVDVPPLELDLTLHNLPDGLYRIRESTLDLTHGNVLHVWGDLDHLRSPHPTDIEYMKSQSIPHVRQRLEQIQGDFHLHSRLGQNEAKMFLLDLYQ